MVHQELLKWFDYYLKIGGFPQVISTFIETQFNYEQSQKVLKQITKTYLLELYEYSECFVNKKPLIAIYKSLATHLSQPSHKFVLSTNNYQVHDDYITIPIYLAFILAELI